MKNSFGKIKFNSFFLPVFLFAGFGGLLAALPGCKDEPNKTVVLEYWCVYDDSDVYTDILKSFQKDYPYLWVNYKKKDFATYETELINALASGRGPDVFCAHNTWLFKHGDKMEPMPEDKEFTLRTFQDTFADVTFYDLVYDQKIYAMPLYVDSLALYYNKDLFAKYGIDVPPKTWDDFKEVVKKLTIKDAWNNITQSGAAIGGTDNINRAVDIVYLLMLQTGTKMVDDIEMDEATFDRRISVSGESYESGAASVEFYANFANPGNEIYTWNDKMHYSIDAFYQGETAMMFNYAHHIPTIQSKSSYFKFDVAPMPQIKGSIKNVNYANYWGLAASQASANSKYAWTFIKWITSKEHARQYAEKSGRPVARKDLIDWQRSDLYLGVFANQVLSTWSWHQVDNTAIEGMFIDMIKSVTEGRNSPLEAVRVAAQLVSNLMKTRK